MTRPKTILLFLFCLSLVISNVALANPPAPEGRTYLVHLVGLADDPYESEPDCLSFGAAEACTLTGDTCMAWQRTLEDDSTSRTSGFTLFGELDQEGLIITIEGRGRVDSRGRKSSISAVAQASALDQRLNFALAGRQIGPRRCQDLIERFSGSPAP